jgi:hypothetical protein
MRGEKSKKSHFARRATKPGFGICVQRALEIRSRFALWSTKLRFREQLRWGHHDGGTNVDPSLAKAQPAHYRSIIENPLSLTLLGEIGFRGVGVTKPYNFKGFRDAHATEPYFS